MRLHIEISQRLFALLVLLSVTSAVGVIYTKHISRQLFSKLQNLQQRRDALHIEWTQLLLEQGAWATHIRVDKIAREQLQMTMPQPNQVEVLR